MSSICFVHFWYRIYSKIRAITEANPLTVEGRLLWPSFMWKHLIDRDSSLGFFPQGFFFDISFLKHSLSNILSVPQLLLANEPGILSLLPSLLLWSLSHVKGPFSLAYTLMLNFGLFHRFSTLAGGGGGGGGSTKDQTLLPKPGHALWFSDISYIFSSFFANLIPFLQSSTQKNVKNL